MRGFLLDENLPARLTFSPSLTVYSSRSVGTKATDTEIWQFARANDLAIVSKDADFSARILAQAPPPKVVHIRLGNLRSAEFHSVLALSWPRVEEALSECKLVTLHRDRIEGVR